MTFFVLSILALIVGAVVFLVGRAMTASNPTAPLGRLITVLAVIGTGLVLALVIAFFTFHTVENGHVGIVKQFGSLVGTTDEGLVTTAPWQSLAEVSVQNEKRDYDMTAENSAVSSDSQAVFLIVQVNFSLEREKAVELYRETGGHFIERILDPAVFQNTKAVTARYKAIDFAKNRDRIRTEIETEIGKEVEPHGLTIQNVSLKNVDFTEALSKAIEQTVEAEQQAKRAEAQVKIKEAEADQLIAEARGQRRAQRLRQQTLTPLLIQQQAIEKLNPNVQVIVCPPRTVCIPNTFIPQP